MSLEQEMKLAVDGESKLNLSELDWLAAMTCEQKQLHLRTEYFDTPQMKLKQQGIALRMRQIDDQWLQTVKTSGKVQNGLHQREEWEHPIMNSEFDLPLLRQTPLAPMVDDSGSWKQLQRLFYTEFDRDIYLLEASQDTQIELAYDFGEAVSGNNHALIHEVELELRHGSLDVLQAVAERLKSALQLSYNNRSKAEIGYQLYQQQKID
ncbi:CYTH domain-containing protein [Methylophaga pinxianii]|uniref:CYTH domain-containing protein n=1 Tax=Methylophaga pinxianii TaxID=2881052 RepID=UPI001CF43CE7|nr:CYTH domain-containing protein [Methylophaga pinxianii]MCB2425912.1 CYTH domain-containing protein [Methylophaga pinxianii]UPH45716.1 CYTH domain-containing protein [Methylophaga pinxianii]